MREKDHAATRRARLGLGAVALILASCWGPSIPAPSDFEVWPQDDALMRLSWVGKSSDVDGHRVYRSDGSGFELIATVGPFTWGCDDTDFVTGTFYTYYVVAFIGADESAHSNHATVEARAAYVDVLTPTDSDSFILGDEIQISWTTNVPDFDARIFLSLDGGSTWLTTQALQYSWTSSFSWTWKVGYRNTEEDEDNPPQWEQLVMTTCNLCKILIKHYDFAPADGESVGTFTIQVP